MDEEVRATIEGRAELSSDDSEREGEPPKVNPSSQQVIERIEEAKDCFQQQQDDCSVQELQLVEMRRTHPQRGPPIFGNQVLF